MTAALALPKPTSDRKRLVLQYYKVRWEKDAEFRAVWPSDKSDLTNALKEWANEQFIRRASALIESSRFNLGSSIATNLRNIQAALFFVAGNT